MARDSIPTPESNIEDAIRSVAERVLARTRLATIDITGVSAPGPLDFEKGEIIGAPNISQESVDLVKPLENFTKKMVVANDAVAAAWAEKALANIPFKDYVMVTIGTGIGGGIVVGGKLLLGRRGGAHEIGHIVLDISGFRCGCGGKGHWEALGGGAWFPRILEHAARNCTSRTGLSTPEKVYARARSGDECALRIIDYMGMIHGAGIASITALFDPEAILLAGGLYWAGRDLLLPVIRRYAREYQMKVRNPLIINATFGPLQSLYGAYAIAITPPRELVELNKHRLSPGVRDPRLKL